MQSVETDVEREERIEELRAQASLFRLLARTLEFEVDEPFLDHLRTTLKEALAEAGAELPDDMANGDPARIVEALATEFTALFVQPGAALPYASVFETGMYFQEPCDRVVRWYAEGGFTFRHRLSGEFPDHVGTMLAFVASQFGAEADALGRADDKGAEEARIRRERFLLEELGPWAPGWCRVARQVAQHPFYERMLNLTERVLWDELALIAPPRRLRELSDRNARGPKIVEKSPEFRKASGL